MAFVQPSRSHPDEVESWLWSKALAPPLLLLEGLVLRVTPGVTGFADHSGRNTRDLVPHVVVVFVVTDELDIVRAANLAPVSRSLVFAAAVLPPVFRFEIGVGIPVSPRCPVHILLFARKIDRGHYISTQGKNFYCESYRNELNILHAFKGVKSLRHTTNE